MLPKKLIVEEEFNVKKATKLVLVLGLAAVFGLGLAESNVQDEAADKPRVGGLNSIEITD